MVQLIRVLTSCNIRVESVAWSPDGKQIASGSKDNTIKIWDSQSGDCQSTLRGHSEDNPECTCFKSDADSDEDENECPVRGHSEDNPECTCFKSDADSDEDETECPVTGHSEGCVFCMDMLEKITKKCFLRFV